MSEGSGELRACQDLEDLGKESSAKSPSQETGGGVFCPEECGSPSPEPWGAPKPAAREEQPRKGRGACASGEERPCRTLPVPTHPNPGIPGWEPDRSDRLDALCAPYPVSRRRPSIWPSVVPWRVPGQASAGLSGLRGPGLSPGAWSPAPGGGPDGVCEVTAASGVSCRAWEFPETLSPPGCYGRHVDTKLLSRALVMQGKWGPDSTSSPSP